MKTLTKKQIKNLNESLLSVCLIYSDFTNNKRRESFGKSMFNRLISQIKHNELQENQIVYKGAQWGGKWGNFYKAIYFRGGQFYFGSGFSNKQILA